MPRSDATSFKEKMNRRKEKAIQHSLGLKYGMKDEDIRILLDSPYEFSYEIIKELPLAEVETEEDLEGIKTNFYYKHLGKLYIPNYMIKYLQNLRERFKTINKEKWKK